MRTLLEWFGDVEVEVLRDKSSSGQTHSHLSVRCVVDWIHTPSWIAVLPISSALEKAIVVALLWEAGGTAGQKLIQILYLLSSLIVSLCVESWIGYALPSAAGIVRPRR